MSEARSAKKPFQDGLPRARRTTSRQAAASGNGKAAMECRATGAPPPRRPTAPAATASATSSAGSRSRPSTGGAGDADRRRRRRERHRGRQERAARGDRLPAVPRQRRQPEDSARTTSRIPTTIGAESSVVDPQLQAVIEARAKATVRPALPGPGDVPGAGRGDQRRDRVADRRHGDARADVPGDHRRGEELRSDGRSRARRRTSCPLATRSSTAGAEGGALTLALRSRPGSPLAPPPDDGRALPGSGVGPLRHSSSWCRSSRAIYYSLFKWNGLQAADQLRRPRQLREGVRRTPVHRTRSATTS